MSNNVAPGLPNLGSTYHGGTPASILTSAGLEGSEASFRNITRNGGAPDTRGDGRYLECRLVRNVSGIALEAGRTVSWKAGDRGTRVDGYTRSTSQEIAGVVDPFLNTGVAPNDLFWIVRKGPCKVKLANPSGTVSEGDFVGALTAASSQAVSSGRVTSITATTTALAVSAIQNIAGRVLVDAAAATEAEVDLDIRS